MGGTTDGVEWKAVPPPEDGDPSLPYATHEGQLRLGDVTLRCYQLSDGQRVFDANDILDFFGIVDDAPVEAAMERSEARDRPEADHA